MKTFLPKKSFRVKLFGKMRLVLKSSRGNECGKCAAEVVTYLIDSRTISSPPHGSKAFIPLWTQVFSIRNPDINNVVERSAAIMLALGILTSPRNGTFITLSEGLFQGPFVGTIPTAFVNEHDAKRYLEHLLKGSGASGVVMELVERERIDQR